MRKIKIAYIGGGSKLWARVFMNDLALAEGICGEIGLYDIDMPAAIRNQKIGSYINKHPKTKTAWDYKVYDNSKDCLTGADFVVMSILPGTFEEMRSDVHAPEEYGIYQSVGDTAGPGGVLRAMRTVPIYEEYAKEIKEYCPNAWVINFTNPMSILVKTLYDVFPEIKCFGCCHEVFHAQEFLTLCAQEILGLERPDRHDIYTDACGVNHFTWITKARYKDIDLLKLIPAFADKYYERGYYEEPNSNWDDFKTDPFKYGNKLKMDLYFKYNALGAAGDRHLAEFFDNLEYLKNPKHVRDWKFNLTTVDFRIELMEKQIAESEEMANGTRPVDVIKSTEEAVELMKAILGFGTIVSNVNMPNKGQMPQIPLGSVVETNCVFTHDMVCPVISDPLPEKPYEMVLKASNNIDDCYYAIKERNLDKLFKVFMNQALCTNLSQEDGIVLFKKMIKNTRNYLDPYFNNIDEFLNS